MKCPFYNNSPSCGDTYSAAWLLFTVRRSITGLLAWAYLNSRFPLAVLFSSLLSLLLFLSSSHLLPLLKLNCSSTFDHSSLRWSTTVTIFSTLLNSRHHPFNGRRSSTRGGASDEIFYTQ